MVRLLKKALWPVSYTHLDVYKRQVLHLDNDKTGRLCTAALTELLKKDYEIVDSPPPVGKDVNDFLMSYLGLTRQSPSVKGVMSVDCAADFLKNGNQTDHKFKNESEEMTIEKL